MGKIVDRLQPLGADDAPMLQEAARLGWHLLDAPVTIHENGDNWRVYRFDTHEVDEP